MSILRKFIAIAGGAAFIYGMGRLYFAVTAGFMLSNIQSDLAPEPRWQISTLTGQKAQAVDEALSQEYLFLGKGCQSYVFASKDGEYVLKFIKFQRFRPHVLFNVASIFGSIFGSIFPGGHEMYQVKVKEKKSKLDKLFISWKLAYEQLQHETGVVFVHLNETLVPQQVSLDRLKRVKAPGLNDRKWVRIDLILTHLRSFNRGSFHAAPAYQDLFVGVLGWNKTVTIVDKIGLRYSLSLGKMQFLLQRKAQMLNETLDRYMTEGKRQQAETLIDRLLQMLLSEYMRGFADNDHALMQNTGVLNEHPIHIDAGQFIYNPDVQDPDLFKREIYDKTYNFSKWLQKRHPALAQHLQGRLVALLGIDYFTMSPYVHKGDVNKIPHIH